MTSKEAPSKLTIVAHTGDSTLNSSALGHSYYPSERISVVERPNAAPNKGSSLLSFDESHRQEKENVPENQM